MGIHHLISAADPDDLTAELTEVLGQYRTRDRHDPYANPVLQVALDIVDALETGRISWDTLENLVQHLTAQEFIGRAERLSRYLGETDADKCVKKLEELFASIAKSGDFSHYRDRLEQHIYGLVITAHPTFSINARLTEALAVLATDKTEDGKKLPRKQREDLLKMVRQIAHQPDTELSLDYEHEMSMTAMANIRSALARVYDIALNVAAKHFPDDWRKLTPSLMTLATWVGYDLDGRNDIDWTMTLSKRLIIQQRQLGHYLKSLAVLKPAADKSDAADTVRDIAKKLESAIRMLDDEIAIFGEGAPDDEAALKQLQELSTRMYETRNERLVNVDGLICGLDAAIDTLGDNDDDLVRGLMILRAELKTNGLGMAHTHVRINSRQLHNAIRKHAGMETEPDDARFRQTYLDRLSDMIENTNPVTINFGSIIAEQTSAKRLFMIIAQMVKYVDASSPVRFLIAETETAFTVLTALYYGKLFGIDEHLEICPLFETEKALERGSRIIDTLLENPHYRAYVEKTGRLCVQTGYSDAGRYIGQTPASGSIERLKFRVGRVMKEHGLENVQLVFFDTHGESIGRGGHPDNMDARLRYLTPPEFLNTMKDDGIPYKQESSFQGGDGYVYFATESSAFPAVTRLLSYMIADHEDEAGDPYYSDKDFITEFYTTVKSFQDRLLENPAYGVLLSTYGANLLHQTGSRATKRQYEIGGTEEGDAPSPSQYRAIPHNAILMQMGLLANTISGVGEAVDKDPDRFRWMYEQSERFQQMMRLVEKGISLSSPEVLKAYIDTMDPLLWQLRATQCPDPARTERMQKVAAHLESNMSYPRLIRIFRELYRDWCALRHGTCPPEAEGKGYCLTDFANAEASDNLCLLHAIRVALIHRVYMLAMKIPPFSPRHSMTPERLVQHILHLDIPFAVEELVRIYPPSQENPDLAAFGEPSTYVSEESENYIAENARIFAPMLAVHDLIRRVSAGVAHRAGFIG